MTRGPQTIALTLALTSSSKSLTSSSTATPYLEQINVNSAIETMEDSTSSLTIFGAAYLRLTFGSPLMSFNSVSYKQDQNHNLQLTWWEKEEKELQAFWTFQDHCWNKQPFMHNLRMNTLILDAQQHIRLTTWKRGNWQLWHRLSNEWWNDLLLSLGDIEHGELGGELVGCHTSHQPWFVWSRRMVTAISSWTSTVTFSAMEILTTTLSSSFCIPWWNILHIAQLHPIRRHLSTFQQLKRLDPWSCWHWLYKFYHWFSQQLLDQFEQNQCIFIKSCSIFRNTRCHDCFYSLRLVWRRAWRSWRRQHWVMMTKLLPIIIPEKLAFFQFWLVEVQMFSANQKCFLLVECWQVKKQGFFGAIQFRCFVPMCT